MKVFTQASLVAICAVIIFGCSKTDFSGKYKGKITVQETGRAIENIDFMLNQKGKEISGNMTITQFPGDGQFKLTGLVDKEKIVFNSESKDGFYLNFTGKANEKAINGDAELTYSGPRIGVKHDKATIEMMKQ
jgi:hypothetical protein